MANFLATSDEAQKKRLIYLKIVYAIGLLMSCIYLIKFNFEYGVHDFNGILLTTWAVMAIIPPVCLYYFKSYPWAAATTLAPLATLLITLLYASGGVDAPGIFWLAAVPLVMAVLLSFPGAVLGYVAVFGSMTYFWYLKINGQGVNIVATYGNYSYEKSFNLVTFLIFTAITTHLYIRAEEKYARHLREKNSDVENLLRVLLHDIANTLSSMTYQLIRVKEGDSSPGMQEIEKIERAVDDISDLLTQVRHLKSVKDGKATLPIKSVPLALILHEVFESSETLASRKGIKICLDIPPENVFIRAEKTILSNVILLNLLNNAIKFSHPGDRIDVRGFVQDSQAIIEIQDYGIGIPQEILESIFSINTKTTRPGTQGEKGTGYGMPLVKEYLQMMHGTIEISSAEQATQDRSRGTKVILVLPIAE